MAIFSYRAMDSTGRIQRGESEALNIVDLEMRLKRLGLDLITGEPATHFSGIGRARIPTRELIQFCFHMEQLTRSGVPLIDALSDLRDSTENQTFRQVIASVVESIEGGQSLSQALTEQGRIFNPVFCALVRAGEASGNLPDVLRELTESLKREDELRSFIGKLVIYPSLVLFVTLAAVVTAMMFVVPQLTRLFQNSGQTLPLQTRILVGVSNFVVSYWPAILLGLAVLIIGGVAWVRMSPRAALRWDRLKLATPIVGTVYRKIILSRFANLFSMMYASGIAIIDTVRTAQDIVGNLEMRDALQRVEQSIAEGQNVTAAFSSARLFPPLVIRMLRVGEHTGSLDHALKGVSYFYERDVKESVERLQTLLEPLLTIVLGGLMLWVATSILGPIYDIITKMKT
ncbi:type II secretion system F family protein [Viridibacterium curvum]|uniref:Type II secretion system F family protein n=1 Tax=Viridibacterium curvum TaxID=1101404 RepID=A0ABP9R0I0_9RHOO